MKLSTPSTEELNRVCETEAYKWLDCLEPLASKPKQVKVTYDSHCVIEREEFNKCVVNWRTNVVGDSVENPSIKIRGEASGLPPLQCAPLSCLYQKCFNFSDYDASLCTAFTKNFKHCTKMLFGSEYVD